MCPVKGLPSSLREDKKRGTCIGSTQYCNCSADIQSQYMASLPALLSHTINPTVFSWPFKFLLPFISVFLVTWRKIGTIIYILL